MGSVLGGVLCKYTINEEGTPKQLSTDLMIWMIIQFLVVLTITGLLVIFLRKDTHRYRQSDLGAGSGRSRSTSINDSKFASLIQVEK